nr:MULTISPECIES: acyl carrier protein [Protofrankia]
MVDLGIDSLAVLQLQGALADRFGVELPEEAGGWTVTRIVAFVNGDLARRR